MSGDTISGAGDLAAGPAGLRHVRAGAVDLCVRDRGSGRAVVLLHGTTATLGVWDAVVGSLGGLPHGGVRTIAVDQRGHGRSGKPATGYGAAEYSCDLAALIETLGCAPVVVAGHSLGARNAVVLGAARPDLVAGVVAVDNTPFVEPEVHDRLDTRLRGGDRSFASLTQIEEYLRARYPRMPSDAVRRRVRYGYVPGDGGHRPLADPSAMVLTVAGLRHDFAAETKAITVPVTLMRGEDSAIVSRAAYSATRALRPDLRAVEVPGADHYVPEENPGAVAAEIAHMLARTR
jgi:2-(acetamidomethylene)succinate hydrolase